MLLDHKKANRVESSWYPQTWGFAGYCIMPYSQHKRLSLALNTGITPSIEAVSIFGQPPTAPKAPKLQTPPPSSAPKNGQPSGVKRSTSIRDGDEDNEVSKKRNKSQPETDQVKQSFDQPPWE